MPSLVFNQETDVQPGILPANATGANFSTAQGQATEQLGQAGTRLAADMNRLKFQQDHADAVANLQKNLSDGYRQFSQYQEELKGTVPENGAGYTDKFVDSFNQWQDKLVGQQPNPQAKRMAAEQARSLGDHFYTKALSYENDTRRNWRTGQLDDSITGGAALIDKDPSAFEPMLRDTTENIKAASADLHPQQGRALVERATKEFSQAAALSWARSHPQDTVNAIQPSEPLPSGGIPAQIADAARAKGVDPHAALTIAQFESGMNPTAANPRSSAKGLFQFIDSTAGDYFPQGVDRTNVGEQAKAGVAFIADNQRAFKDTLGHDPSTPELYGMHLLGLGGGMALAKAPNNLPFDQLATQFDPRNHAAITANNGFSGLTVGQVKAKIANWMQDAGNKTAGLAKAADNDANGETAPGTSNDLPWLQHLAPNDRQAILTHAQSNLKKDDMGARAIVDQQTNDAITQLQNGVMPPKVPSFDDLVKAGYPAAQASIKASQIQNWQNYGAAVSKVRTQSPDEQLQTLAQSRPEAGDPNYTQKLDAYNHLDNAIQQINRVRGADPVAYDQATGSTNVTRPIDFSNPDFLQGPLSSRFAQAEQVARVSGTPYQPFSKQEATQLGQFFDKADPKTAVDYLAAIRNAAPSAEHFTSAMAQIAPTHPILATAAQIGQANPSAAYTVLQGDRILNPGRADPEKEGKGKIPLPPVNAFSQAWDTARGQAYQGLPQSSQADMAAAIAYYVGAQPAGARNEKTIDPDLWKRAVNAVAPSADYNGRSVLVPAGSDPTKFADTIASKWTGTLAAHGLDAKDYPVSQYSLVSAGQDGVYVPVNGTSPLYANGQKVVIDLNQAEHTPLPVSAPETPAPTKRDLKNRQLTLQDLKMAQRFR